MSIRIAGTGSYVPDRVMTNADLEKMVETSDEWIRTRTGIQERRIAAPEQATSDLAYEAGPSPDGGSAGSRGKCCLLRRGRSHKTRNRAKRRP